MVSHVRTQDLAIRHLLISHTHCRLRFYDSSNGLLASEPGNFHPGFFRDQLAPVVEPPPSLQCDMTDLSHDCFSIFPPPQNYETPYMTSRGLRLTLPTWQLHDLDERVMVCITLSKRNNAVELVCVSLYRLSLNMMERGRFDDDLTFLPESEHVHFSYETFYVIEPRPETSVSESSTNENAPTVLILKLNGTYSERLSCYFSPWPSMMDLLQLDSVSDGEELVPPQVHTIQGHRPVDVPSLFAGIAISGDDNVWYFPKAQDFSRYGKFDQCIVGSYTNKTSWLPAELLLKVFCVLGSGDSDTPDSKSRLRYLRKMPIVRCFRQRQKYFRIRQIVKSGLKMQIKLLFLPIGLPYNYHPQYVIRIFHC